MIGSGTILRLQDYRIAFTDFAAFFTAGKDHPINNYTTMARVLCIDYGQKRCGVAATDAMRIIATSLGMVAAPKLMAFLKDYAAREPVARIIIGYPTHADGNPTHATPLVETFMKQLKKQMPHIPVEKIDERYSSKMASRAIAGMGLRKKEKERKGLVDEVAAVMLLQEWMEQNPASAD